MRILQRWLNSASLRYILTITGFRNNNARKEYEFEPYFQYKIGPYEKDYTLYFSTKPSKLTYHREIFAKMIEYDGYSLVGYLDYHYKAYADKKEFLRFIRYETLEKIKFVQPGTYKSALELVLEWNKEEENKLEKEQEKELAQEKERTRMALADSSNGNQDLGDASPEAAMNSLAGPFSGKIELNNQLNMEKYIQLLILTQVLKTPGRNGEYLFKNFSNTDMAGILCQFEHLGELRMNTLQKKVADAKKNLRLDDPRVEKLNKALQEFFYR